MTELNETLETKDSEKEDLIPENSNLSGTDADADENPYFAKNWMSIAKPRKLQFETESLKADYGKFTLDPLEPGYGITIGHSLRRVLLSSIRGSAIFAVQIDGVTHEFTSIPGIVEDMVQVILNIKELQIEQFVDEETSYKPNYDKIQTSTTFNQNTNTSSVTNTWIFGSTLGTA